MSFEPERNSFQQDYNKHKQQKVDAARQAHARQQAGGTLQRLQKENELLRKKLERREKQLATIKGYAVHLRTQAGKMSGYSPKNMIDLSTDILKAINGK